MNIKTVSGQSSTGKVAPTNSPNKSVPNITKRSKSANLLHKLIRFYRLLMKKWSKNARRGGILGKLSKKIYKYSMTTFILVIYITLTGWIFYAIEKDERQIVLCSEVCVGATIFALKSRPEVNIFGNSSYVPKRTARFINDILSNDTRFDAPKLTYWDAFHLVATSVTTIGYGDVYPRTVSGQILIIIFTLIGAPILLASMASLGRFFGLLFHSLWVRLYTRSHKPPYTMRQNKMLKNRHYLPLWIGCLISILWIVLSTLYFSNILPRAYENERDITLFDAFYFTMISFLTVGFGDISPLRHQLIVPNFIFLLVGLSLFTMCIDLTQNQLELLFDDVAAMILEKNDSGKQSSETTSHSSESASSYVRRVLKGGGGPTSTSVGAKILLPLLSHKKQRQLKKLALDRRRNISRMIQTMAPKMQDAQTQTVASKDFVYYAIDYSAIGKPPPAIVDGHSLIKKRTRKRQISLREWEGKNHEDRSRVLGAGSVPIDLSRISGSTCDPRQTMLAA
uniref:Potassium channel domain-containing protein n=1 Tax=Romanomermis culicivorax TaxID=13658 RepID=A0A915HZ60_ROMCU